MNHLEMKSERRNKSQGKELGAGKTDRSKIVRGYGKPSPKSQSLDDKLYFARLTEAEGMELASLGTTQIPKMRIRSPYKILTE